MESVCIWLSSEFLTSACFAQLQSQAVIITMLLALCILMPETWVRYQRSKPWTPAFKPGCTCKANVPN